jgi:hypothetical protein
LAQVYLDGVGWIDDGGGDSGYQEPTPASQSPYAYNQTYNEPPAQSPYQWNYTYNPPAPTVSDFYSLESQAQPPAYQPTDPFKIPTVSDFYQQESQTYQPSIPKANPWSFSSFTSQPQPNYYDYYSQEATAQAPQADPLNFNNPPLFMGTSANMKLTPPGPTFSENPETPFSLGDYTSEEEKPYKPTFADFAYRPKLPYEQGYNPQVGSQVDPSKLFEYASPETMKNLDPFNMVMTVLGGAIAPVGMGVDVTADSGIPGVSQAAQAARFAWEQAVEPAGNLFTSTVGALSQGGDVLDLAHGAGPAGWLVGGAADVIQGRDPTQYYKDVAAALPVTRLISATSDKDAAAWASWRNQQVQQEYDSQIAAGKSPQEARIAAQRLGEKLLNAVNAAEYSGLQSFSQLPAVAQLPIMLADPVGNKVYGEAIKPFTHGLPTAIKATSDVTGLSNQIDKALDATVRPGSQKAFRFGQVADRVADTLTQQAEALSLPAADVMSDFLTNKASPLYWEKIIPGANKDRVKQAVVDKVTQIYNASPLTDLSKPDTAITGGKIGVGQSELGVRMQDTTGQVDPFSTTPAPQAEAAPAAPRTGSDLEFDNLKSATPAVAPTKLPDSYKPIKLPNRDTGEISEFFNAAKTAQAIDVKALKLDGTVGKPTLRVALPLEEWGKLGAAIRGVNRYTTQPLSRVYLETLSRAVRDPASNILKLGVVDPGAVASAVFRRFGIGDANAINAQFKTIFGDVESLGPSSITADVGGKAGKTSGIANLMYHVANPFNELSADVLRSVTGGKFQSYSKFIEDNETTIKELLYRREALRAYNEAVKSGPKTEFFKKNPEIWQAVQSGKMSLEQLDRVIQGRTFNGFDMDDLANNRYNPAIPSDWLDKELEGVSGGTAGTYGKILKEGIGSLAERVKKENERRLEAQRKVSGYYRAKTPKAKEAADASARANANLIRLEDLDSNHPIVQQMLSDVLDAYDANRITLFPQDNAIYAASHFLINAAINYASDTGRYDLFSTTFKDAQATRKAAYAMKYKAPQPTFAERVASKNLDVDLKNEILAYGKLPGRSYPANKVLKTIEGKGTPGEVVVAYQKDGATHFRPTDPAKVRPGETVVWDGKQSLPQATPGPKADYATLYEQVNNPPNVRFKVDRPRGGKTWARCLAPDTMRKMAAKFNRTETFTTKGALSTRPLTREQMNRWFQDFMATDQYYRQISHNTFKLDPDTLSPVRISRRRLPGRTDGQARPRKDRTGDTAAAYRGGRD